MSKYRNNLPQFGNQTFISDGGLETVLIFEHGIDLPEFAAFTLLEKERTRSVLRNYFLPYIDLAKKYHFGFILESPTWRASKGWGEKIGYDKKRLASANHQAIGLMAELRRSYEDESIPMIISGCLGPRGDGYLVDEKMTISKAKSYHSTQIKTFSETEADLVSAFTINYVEEAIGITLAAQNYGIPAVISFTLETDGRLPSGQPLGSAINEVDEATNNGPAYYMINCAHPLHFRDVLTTGEPWVERILAIRANASCKSHEELEEMEDLDTGNPEEFGEEYANLIRQVPHLNVFGGCCGTDIRHIAKVCQKVIEQQSSNSHLWHEHHASSQPVH